MESVSIKRTSHGSTLVVESSHGRNSKVCFSECPVLSLMSPVKLTVGKNRSRDSFF